jgi:TRAP-type C4-dicarboxylate transport system permease large subunit
MMSPIGWIAIAVFVSTYILLAAEVVHKTTVTILGAAVFLFLHILDSKEAYSLIDWNVIFLLIGMMIIVAITRRSGMFQYVAIRAARLARGEPVRILILLSLVTAVFSAFLDNVTTILIIAPVTILIAVELNISPLPFLICNAIASNIGGTATLIGDPPNIIIGSAARLSFLDFLSNLGPVILIILAAFTVFSLLAFRGQMKVSATRKARIMSFDERRAIENKPLLIRSLIVLALVITGFLLHDALGVEVSVVALSGAFVLMAITERHEVEKVFLESQAGYHQAAGSTASQSYRRKSHIHGGHRDLGIRDVFSLRGQHPLRGHHDAAYRGHWFLAGSGGGPAALVGAVPGRLPWGKRHPGGGLGKRGVLRSGPEKRLPDHLHGVYEIRSPVHRDQPGGLLSLHLAALLLRRIIVSR